MENQFPPGYIYHHPREEAKAIEAENIRREELKETISAIEEGPIKRALQTTDPQTLRRLDIALKSSGCDFKEVWHVDSNTPLGQTLKDKIVWFTSHNSMQAIEEVVLAWKAWQEDQ